METLKHDFEQLKALYHKEKGALTQLQEEKRKKEADLALCQEQKEGVTLKRTLLQEASDEARKQASELLQNISTRALQYVLGEHLSLEIRLTGKRNTANADILVKNTYEGYEVETDPAEEEGGGVADVVSFSTLITMLQLSGEDNTAPMFLDEPSKFVSKGHSEKVALFLHEMSKYYERQTFMVTHDEYLASVGDKAYHFKIEEGKTVVSVV